MPVGYFSWAKYDILASEQPKTENALAAAFISNFGAHNLRLQALEFGETGFIWDRQYIKRNYVEVGLDDLIRFSGCFMISFYHFRINISFIIIISRF